MVLVVSNAGQIVYYYVPLWENAINGGQKRHEIVKHKPLTG
jgi:hypothetical protein